MATLNTFLPTGEDSSPPIATLAELRANLPAVPVIPTLFALGYPGGSVQLRYGSPDRYHATVTHVHGADTDRETFDRNALATARFLELAREVL